MHHLVVGSLQSKRLVQPRRKALHALARAQDEFGLGGRGLGHPSNRQGGFGLAVFREEGRVDDEAVKGRFECCCGNIGWLDFRGIFVHDVAMLRVYVRESVERAR